MSTSPRTELVLDHFMFNASTYGVRGAIRQGQYKLLVGPPGGEAQATWYGQFSPNASNPSPSLNYFACGNDVPPGGCLFDVEADPGEHTDLASTMPDVFAQLMKAFHSYNSSYHPPNNNPAGDQAGLCAAAVANNYTAVPWRSEPVPEGGGPATFGNC